MLHCNLPAPLKLHPAHQITITHAYDARSAMAGAMPAPVSEGAE